MRLVPVEVVAHEAARFGVELDAKSFCVGYTLGRRVCEDSAVIQDEERLRAHVRMFVSPRRDVKGEEVDMNKRMRGDGEEPTTDEPTPAEPTPEDGSSDDD